ncbi:MAG TPA: DedA family protein, partial [Acidobacteriaceae bacterium]
ARLLNWLRRKFHMDDEIETAKDQIRRHGGATVFWARYVFGLRTITGPVAGALGMEWKKFLLWNALGAVTWVSSIALTGYAFSHEFNSLLSYFEKASWVISAGIFGVGYVLWRRRKAGVQAKIHAKGRVQGDGQDSAGD